MSQNFILTSVISIVLTLIVFKLTLSTPLSSNENEIEDDSIDLSMFGKKIFGHPNDKTGDLIASYKFDGNTDGNPEEHGSYLEGDLLIPSKEQTERNGIIGKSYRWPDGVVPYEIEGEFTKNELSIIQYAFDQYHNKTCIRFRERTTERNYISITNKNTGCWSGIGRIGGRQSVNLQSPVCLKKNGTAIHELMHVLGFFHEHSRSNRDKYIRILNKNVKPTKKSNFQKLSSKKIYGFGMPYDYASVMHYSKKAFSRNGKDTILALDKTRDSSIMGQRIGFSDGDIAKINAMYKCKLRDVLKDSF